jgi:hypothetical protein
MYEVKWLLNAIADWIFSGLNYFKFLVWHNS